jgi:hypothetical protein
MDKQRARTLLEAERARVKDLLNETASAGQEDRATATRREPSTSLPSG